MVALDLRIVAFDLFPDALGWGLVALGAWGLSRATTAGLAAAAGLASLPEVLLPSHYEALDPITGEVVPPERAEGLAFDEQLAFDAVAGVRLALMVAAAVVGAAALWLLLGHLRQRAARSGDAASASKLGLARLLVVGAWIVPYVVIAGSQWLDDGTFDPVWNGAFEAPGLIGLAALLPVIWLLLTNNGRRWAMPSAPDRLSPWTELMGRA